MDIKPFISSNKIARPSFGYYDPIQSDNIVILAATLEDEGSLEITPESEPFVEKWGAVVKSYVIEEFYHSVPKKYKSDYLCLFEIVEHMSPLYSLGFLCGVSSPTKVYTQHQHHKNCATSGHKNIATYDSKTTENTASTIKNTVSILANTLEKYSQEYDYSLG